MLIWSKQSLFPSKCLRKIPSVIHHSAGSQLQPQHHAVFFLCLKEDRVRLSLPSNDNEDVNDVGECPVCIEVICAGHDFMKLPCDHTFHVACATPWFNEHNTCPVCRFSLKLESEEVEPKVLFPSTSEEPLATSTALVEMTIPQLCLPIVHEIQDEVTQRSSLDAQHSSRSLQSELAKLDSSSLPLGDATVVGMAAISSAVVDVAGDGDIRFLDDAGHDVE